jgi:transcriptional regulator with XRE-family HTH domain
MRYGVAMADYSMEALGQVVRDLRGAKKLTQDELGKKAGYRGGAGVSISRIEGGLLRPGGDRFAGLAAALGLTPDELEARASRQTVENVAVASAATGVIGSAAGAALVGGATARSAERPKDRIKRIKQDIDERTRVITDLGERFNQAHDRARDEFFMRFVVIAGRLEGAPPPDPPQLEGDEVSDADAEAAFQLKVTSYGVEHVLAGGAGGAAAGKAVGGGAYGTFMEAVSSGTASTGAAISGLSRVATTNATLGLLRGKTLAASGKGIAGRTLVQAGIGGAAAAVLVALGLFWMTKRNRKEQQELAAKLDEAEAEINATQRGFDALQEILPQATKTLDYVAVHAGHALNRWEAQLGTGTSTWDSLSQAEQQRYRDFIEIAAAQLAVATIDFQGLMTTQDSDRNRLIELTEDVLARSDSAVTARV